jgi:HAD superfamily hydrolase (TIGR01509 family)
MKEIEDALDMVLLEKPRFIVFDFDGVLADTDTTWFSVVADALASQGVTVTADALLAGHRGKVITESAREFERDYSITLPPGWADQVVARASAEIDRNFLAVPGAVEAVRSVAAAKLPLAVASGSLRHALASGLRRLGLGDIVKDRFVSSHDHGEHKPHPGVYLRACARLGLAPELGVAVEDSATGIASARAAGMAVIGFAPEERMELLLNAGATLVIHRMADLPDALKI